jgi:hypothetical protein
MMPNHKFREAIKKIYEQETELDRHKLIWQWAKEGRINLVQFRQLLQACEVAATDGTIAEVPEWQRP